MFFVYLNIHNFKILNLFYELIKIYRQILKIYFLYLLTLNNYFFVVNKIKNRMKFIMR